MNANAEFLGIGNVKSELLGMVNVKREFLETVNVKSEFVGQRFEMKVKCEFLGIVESEFVVQSLAPTVGFVF